MRSRARRLLKQYGKLGLVIVDYIQLMQASSQGENRATEISEISRSLKGLAKELKVPVIALSQLNRSLEQRPNKRPVMSDLRECVTGDTLVMLADGRARPIRDLVGSHAEVWAFDVDGQRLMRARVRSRVGEGRPSGAQGPLASGGSSALPPSIDCSDRAAGSRSASLHRRSARARAIAPEPAEPVGGATRT